MDLDYDLGSWGADGSFGAKTTSAVKAYQTKKGVTSDGIVGKTTGGLLEDEAVSGDDDSDDDADDDASLPSSDYTFSSLMKVGSEGTEVEELQTLLNASGLTCGTADGVFGAKTSSCVKAYQILKNLTADGIVGAQTRTELNKL